MQAALVYVVNPIDIIPDAIPVVGYTDDWYVLSSIASPLRTEMKRYRAIRTTGMCSAP